MPAMSNLLSTIESPADLRRLSRAQLHPLAAELRRTWNVDFDDAGALVSSYDENNTPSIPALVIILNA